MLSDVVRQQTRHLIGVDEVILDFPALPVPRLRRPESSQVGLICLRITGGEIPQPNGDLIATDEQQLVDTLELLIAHPGGPSLDDPERPLPDRGRIPLQLRPKVGLKYGT